MPIKINDIPPEGLTIELDDMLDLFETGRAATPFRASLTVSPTGKGIYHVAGRIQGTAELECSRCLRAFPFHVDEKEIAFDLYPEGWTPPEQEHELNRGEMDVEFYRGDEIDPRDLVREQLLLDLPMVPVHSAGCKGLCPTCGADLNAAPCGCAKPENHDEANPFAVLKKILNPQKE